MDARSDARALRASLPGRLVATEPPRAELLRRLALHDERVVSSIVSAAGRDFEILELGDKTHALLRIGALISADSATTSYQWAVSSSPRAAGATDEEVVAVLCAIAPIVGSARVTVATPSLASALGYELDPFED